MTRFDLHVHTALSACAENALSPARILKRAVDNGVTMLAITDHNASGNVRTAVRLGEARGVKVIPGVEVMTREEVHVLVLYDSVDALEDWQQVIDEALPVAENNEEFFGYQLLYDEHDDIVGVDERLRQVGISLGLERVTAEVHRRGGFVVPAHVFRARHSLTSQLGFIDADGKYDALELRSRDWRRQGFRLGDRVAGYPLITGSDSHFLEDVGRVSLELEGALGTCAAVLGRVRRMAA